MARAIDPRGLDALRSLGRTRSLPKLSARGRAIESYIAGWVGPAAVEPVVNRGIARLADLLDRYCGREDRPREVLRGMLELIGMRPANGQIGDRGAADYWFDLVVLMAEVRAGYQDFATEDT